MTKPTFRLAAALIGFAMACDSSGTTGCVGGAFTTLPQGSFQGERVDSSGALRLTASGFNVLNHNSPQILELFAPGGQLVVPIPCQINNPMILGIGVLPLAIADEGSMYCTDETCGLMDGKCDSKDLPKTITINFSSLHFAPASPDILQASVTATVQTGLLHISTVSRNSALCLFSGLGPAKCTVDFDTTRAGITDNDLQLNIKLAIDQRWNKLLSLQVDTIGGAKVCGTSGALPSPACIDSNDVIIANAGTCTACTAANFSIIKTILLDQITKSLQDTLNKAIGEANCASCEYGGVCPSNAIANSACRASDAGTPDSGTCFDTMTNVCVPAALGIEGQLNVGTLLSSMGAPAGSALQLALAAGGSSAADDAGMTLGMRGGTQANAVAECVKALSRPMPLALPLPNLDTDAPGPYDVGLSISGQFLTSTLFDAQQSGALCLQLGHETITQLDSSLLATLLPSLNLVTHNQAVPLRIAIRPVNPPTASIGEGTFNTDGTLKEPLIRVDWPGLQLDVYTLIEDRYARLFTIKADVALPLGLRAEACAGVTPVLGSLATSVTNVSITNNEILSEPVATLERLVPTLLSLAEPSLASGFQAIALPDILDFSPRPTAARGIGHIAGTKNYNHLGIFADAVLTGTPCTLPQMRGGPRAHVTARHRKEPRVDLQFADTQGEYAWRLAGGFWSPLLRTDAQGVLAISHPRLLLNAPELLEVKDRAGNITRLNLESVK